MSLSSTPLSQLHPIRRFFPLDRGALDFVDPNNGHASEGKPLRAHLLHLLAGSLVLYLNYRRYAQTAADSGVPELHDLFEAYAESEKICFDLVAEHVRELLADSETILEETSRLSQIKQARENATLFDHLQEASSNSVLWADQIRLAMRVAKQSKESIIGALLAEYLRAHEMRSKYLVRLLQRSQI